ncbi:hypothetical protein ACFZB6_28560 [Streptomyces syringium]|uniref:hypothetical protein n=1 Tax=Streptomyces syringium TaxID=76729 RepID=UPI0033B7D192
MIRRTALRTLTTTAVIAPLALRLPQGAQAAAPAADQFSFALATDIAERTVAHPARSAWSTPSSCAPARASRSATATPAPRTGPASSPRRRP